MRISFLFLFSYEVYRPIARQHTLLALPFLDVYLWVLSAYRTPAIPSRPNG